MRCTIETCDRKAVTRGLCHSCYLTALRLVKAGETTWSELEQKGLCGPMMRTMNAFARAYSEKQPETKDLPGQTKLFPVSPDVPTYELEQPPGTDVSESKGPNPEVVQKSIEQAKQGLGQNCDEILDELLDQKETPKPWEH